MQEKWPATETCIRATTIPIGKPYNLSSVLSVHSRLVAWLGVFIAIAELLQCSQRKMNGRSYFESIRFFHCCCRHFFFSSIQNLPRHRRMPHLSSVSHSIINPRKEPLHLHDEALVLRPSAEWITVIKWFGFFLLLLSLLQQWTMYCVSILRWAEAKLIVNHDNGINLCNLALALMGNGLLVPPFFFSWSSPKLLWRCMFAPVERHRKPSHWLPSFAPCVTMDAGYG